MSGLALQSRVPYGIWVSPEPTSPFPTPLLRFRCSISRCLQPPALHSHTTSEFTAENSQHFCEGAKYIQLARPMPKPSH